MLASHITVNTAVVRLADGALGTPDRPVTVIVSPQTSSIFLGGPNVTAAAGFEVASTDPFFAVELVGGEDLYAIAAGAVVVHVLQSGS